MAATMLSAFRPHHRRARLDRFQRIDHRRHISYSTAIASAAVCASTRDVATTAARLASETHDFMASSRRGGTVSACRPAA